MFALVATGAAAAVAVAYGVLIERTWFALRHIRVPCLREGQPIRVLHLSDLHLLADQRAPLEFLRRLAGERVDLVVCTGDFLGGSGGIEPAIEAMAAFHPRIAAAYVLGSNDYFAPKAKNYLGYFARGRPPVLGVPIEAGRLKEGLGALGWLDLSNRESRIGTPGGHIDLAGMDDPHIRRNDVTVPRETTGSPLVRLALTHTPDRRSIRAFATAGYDLVLAGHTHGGQVRIPGFGALVTNCDVPRRSSRGLSRVSGIWLHVSAGLGTSRFAPFRFACRPEATLLELVASQDAGSLG
ncbi:MAG: metallophosphoesterase [Actinomycetota bacterium]